MTNTPPKTDPTSGFEEEFKRIESVYTRKCFPSENPGFDILSTIRYDPRITKRQPTSAATISTKNFFLFPEHCSRLEYTLKYFSLQYGLELDFDVDPDFLAGQLKLAIELSGKPVTSPYKIRLLMNLNGDVKVEVHETLDIENLFRALQVAEVEREAMDGVSEANDRANEVNSQLNNDLSIELSNDLSSNLSNDVSRNFINNFTNITSNNQDALDSLDTAHFTFPNVLVSSVYQSPPNILEQSLLDDWDVYIDSQPTFISPFTSFKTTNRQHYTDARNRRLPGVRPGREEVLVYNHQNDMMEGSITSFAVRRKSDGMWITPQLSSGCLCGVMRHFLLRKDFMEEEVIKLDSLAVGTEVMLFNGVMGVVRGRICK
jgi:Branched-chain amino acid aminotransferase/4-amino-4-deoxychorismate lyase